MQMTRLLSDDITECLVMIEFMALFSFDPGQIWGSIDPHYKTIPEYKP